MTTSEFGVQLTGRAGQQVTVQSDMQFAPVSWTAAAVGGPKAAEITLAGSRSALKDALLNWLGFGVQVTTPSGGPCWWGYVHEVALTLDGAEIVASLDRLRNRVAVTYTALQGGIETALTTEWADDLASQSAGSASSHHIIRGRTPFPGPGERPVPAPVRPARGCGHPSTCPA